MRPAWRLATSELWARPTRTALLTAAVALSSALVVAVVSSLSSANAAIEARMDQTVGAGDLKITAGAAFDAGVLNRVRTWPEVARVEGRLTASVRLQATREVYANDNGRWRLVRRSYTSSARINGVGGEGEATILKERLVSGRLATGPGEIVVDSLLAEKLGWTEYDDERYYPGVVRITKDLAVPGAPLVDEATARTHNAKALTRVGEQIELRRFLRSDLPLTIVGIADQPPLGGRAECYLPLAELGRILGTGDRSLSEIVIELAPGYDPEAVAARHRDEIAAIDQSLLLQTSAKITSGLDQNIRSSELGFVLAAVLATMSASFIVVTGLTTSVAQRQKELGVVRCIGATRWQLAGAQLLIGAALGIGGALIGVPFGIAIAAVLTTVLHGALPTGLVVPASAIGLGAATAVVSGVLGAAWPAFLASRVSPLKAMASRAVPVRARGVALVTAIGLAGALTQVLAVTLPADSQVAFWSYVIAGLPAMLVGYFLLGVPAILIASSLGAGLLSRLLGLPRNLLGRTIMGTAYRFGLTSGALMAGLALMVVIWTNGGAMLRDWLGKIEFPDAFVNGPALSSGVQDALESLDCVKSTCAISTYPIKTDAFGVRALQSYLTTFIAFEPRKFFAMTRLQWVQGDPETAIERLEQGGAVIVAREFMVTQGLGVGDIFKCEADGVQHEFEIVGVVTSPGLEIVSKFFNIGDEMHQQAVHAVFGSRKDLKEQFHTDVVHLIQIDLVDDVDEAAAMNQIDRALIDFPIFDSGSGKAIKEQIRQYAIGTLVVFSAVGVTAMLVASFGVANVIAAGIDARKHEFGVLRAVGASRSLLARLVIGEAILVSVAACVLGVSMGLQAAWGGQGLYRRLLGLELSLVPAWGAIGVACLVLTLLALAAAWPSVWRLGRMEARELLGHH